MIGQGYYDTITPAVIRRGILTNPAWYSAYTPYQAEISQGRLEAMLNFQTMVSDLTALPVANASLLDESTAVGEAVLLMARANAVKGAVVLDAECFPQTLEVVLAQARRWASPRASRPSTEGWTPHLGRHGCRHSEPRHVGRACATSALSSRPPTTQARS